MKALLVVPSFLLLSLPLTLGAQEPADSTQNRVATQDVEAPPLWVGARLSDLLIARRAGFLVSPAGGAVGSAGRFRIRGPQTIADDRMPLVILDGLRMDAASELFGGSARLEDLNPEEIASIEVIPGAAGTAVYGPGAANGVIVVRTKEGRRGAPKWEVYSEAGVRRPYRRWPVRYGGIDADNASVRFRSGDCSLRAVAAGSCVQDSIFRYGAYAYSSELRTAVTRQNGLAVSGGVPQVDYYLSGEFDGDGGLFALSSGEAERLAALGQPPRDATRYPEHYGGAHLRGNLRLRPSSALEVVLRTATMSNDVRLPAPNPSLRYDPFRGDWFQVENTQALDRWLRAADVEWRPLPRFRVRYAIAYDHARRRDRTLQRWAEGPRSPEFAPTGWVTQGGVGIDTRAFHVSAVYEFGSPRGAWFRTTIGFEHDRFQRDSGQLVATLDSGTTTIDSAAPYASYALFVRGRDRGLYVQQQVDFKGRLEVTAGLRRDEFQFYSGAVVHPSIAVSWLALPSMRVRTAYGSAGRRPKLYASEPERTRELTVGADGTLLAGRVHAGATLYSMRSNVVGVYTSTPLPGYPAPVSIPGARVSNRGIEIAVSGQVVRRPEAAFDVTVTAWGNRNRVTALDGPQVFGLGGSYFEGYPAGGFWSVPVVAFNDANGDGIIYPNEVSGLWPRWAGTPYPTQGAALTGDLRVRGVRLGATLDYQAGHTAFNQAAWVACLYLQCREVVDPATPLAQQAEAVASANWPAPRFFEDADFLKLREVWVSIGAPRGLATALRARAATLALVGRNLHTWTGYSGIDPEPTVFVTGNGSPEAVEDRLVMPRLPEWSLRLRLTY
jgi:TonB-dependent SusC/RagA subfamily outer membrane receptor